METQERRKSENAHKVAGIKGMEEGYDPHMVNVSRIVRDSWDMVSDMKIVLFWVKSKVLPKGIQTKVKSLFWRMKPQEKEYSVQDTLLLFELMTMSQNSATAT